MKTLFVLVFGIALLTKSYSQNHDKKPIKYLALGDSYTIGESVSELERFPFQLSAQLNENGYDVNSPTIIAKTGWTTDELLAALDEKEPIGKYDFVTLLIGVNNQYRGRSSKEFREQFIHLLERAAGYTASIRKVIIISIPDWGVTPFAKKMNRDPLKVGNEIEEFNSIIKKEADKAGATFINITDISKDAAEDKSLLADDALHPSGKMYSLWVKRILPAAKFILDKE